MLQNCLRLQLYSLCFGSGPNTTPHTPHSFSLGVIICRLDGEKGYPGPGFGPGPYASEVAAQLAVRAPGSETEAALGGEKDFGFPQPLLFSVGRAETMGVSPK